MPKGELSGFQAKGDTKPPATLSRMGSESSRESSISDRKLPPAESFKDESSVFSKDSSISQSITETVAAQSVGTTPDSLYEIVNLIPNGNHPISLEIFYVVVVVVDWN